MEVNFYNKLAVSINILTENFEDIVAANKDYGSEVDLPSLTKILEDSGHFSRKNMLKVNEKAFELLNLLRSEIFAYYNFLIKTYEVLLKISKDEPNLDSVQSFIAGLKYLKKESGDSGNTLVACADEFLVQKQRKLHRVATKMLVNHVLVSNHSANSRLMFDKSRL